MAEEEVLFELPQVTDSDEEVEGDAGPSLLEIDAALKVLQSVVDKSLDISLLSAKKAKKIKAVRTLADQLGSQIQERKFGGMTKEADDERRRKDKDKAAIRQRMKMLDLQRINNREMRAHRFDALAKMTLPTDPSHLLTDKSHADKQAEEALKKQSSQVVVVDVTGEEQEQEEEKEKNKAEAVVPTHMFLSQLTQNAYVPIEEEENNDLIPKRQAARDFVDCKDSKDIRRGALEIPYWSPSDDEAEVTHEVTGDYEKDGDLLHFPRSCYICKRRFHRLHRFYDQLCPPCARLNWEKRHQTADLTDRVILLTGARVKIGFEAGTRLLKCGATLIATSRFPHDTAKRYAAHPDYAQWTGRLHIFGLDMRDLSAVVKFTQVIAERFNRLDGIVNNAAQTIRRPRAYYQHLLEDESRPLLPALAGLVGEDVHDRSGATKLITSPTSTVNVSAVLSQVAFAPEDTATAEEDAALFPEGHFDITGQQLDMRKTNSWLLLLDQVEPAELVEVFTINALSPFIINSRLKRVMTRFASSLEVDKYIINVSAMEGKFYRHKGPEHPHTNMAKAALNMMTRTSAVDYARQRIFMNSVDTGWINDENPTEKEAEIRETGNFQTPIDEADAAARILDPILTGVRTGINPCGQFFKDYYATEW